MWKPPSNWSIFLNNTSRVIREGTRKVITMEGSNPNKSSKTLWTFHSHQDLYQYALGCDSDIGGTSTANLTMDGDDGKARFWGEMKLGVKPGLEKKVRGGYAGFRNKTRNSLFGEIEDDVSFRQYLVLRLKVGGDRRTHNSYYCNIQTSSLIATDLYQHRLWFSKPYEWEDIAIPFNAFVLTNYGHLISRESNLMIERIKTVGISILGGNSGIEGQYELGLDSIKAVNEEDLDVVPMSRGSGFKSSSSQLQSTNDESEGRN